MWEYREKAHIGSLWGKTSRQNYSDKDDHDEIYSNAIFTGG